jgi:prolyl oligopeptidase
MGDFEFLHNIGTKFFFITNYNAPSKRIISLDINFPQEENWREIIHGGEENIIESADFIYNKLVVTYLDHGANRLRIYGLNSHETEAELLNEV